MKPINRLNKFFSEKEFELEKQFGMEYLYGDLNTTVNYYSINLNETDMDDLYGETPNNLVALNTPISLPCIYQLTKSENKSYNDNTTMRFEESGNLIIHIYLDILRDLGIKLNYGDFIGFQLNEKAEMMFTIANPANFHFENEKTLGGYKSFFKTVICTPTDKEELNFKYL